MAGIASKPSDCDWVKYVEQFDFVTLVGTFVDNTFDMSVFFLLLCQIRLSSCQVVIPRETIRRCYRDG